MKEDVARYEWFTGGADGERKVAAFWLVGRLKGIERRARREKGPEGQRPSGFEVFLAFAIAIGATVAVLTLL